MTLLLLFFFLLNLSVSYLPISIVFFFFSLEFLLLNKWYNFSFNDAVFIQEAKQALELMGKWEMIDVSDALELLSPVFESEEVLFKSDLRQNCNQWLYILCLY